MKSTLAVAVAAAVWLLWSGGAQADSVAVTSGGGQFGSNASHAVPGASSDGSFSSGPVQTTTAPAGHWVERVQCVRGGQQTCAEPAYCADGSILMEHDYVLDQTGPAGTVGATYVAQSYCASSHPADATADPVGPTVAQIYEAFRSVVPNQSALRFQPAGNQTLVHFKSNFYTDAAPFEAAVDLPVGPASFHVDFKIRPIEFHWTFGDGTTAKTSTPGAPYPNLEVTHEYQKAGKVAASVTTVWGADYRVNGGPWAPVNGTVTKTGPEVAITVRQATPVLTD